MVHDQATKLVDKRKIELKEAKIDLKKYENTQKSQTEIIQEANTLIDKVNQLNKKILSIKDHTSEICKLRLSLETMVTLKGELELAVAAENNILDILKSIPHKGQKHGYKPANPKKYLEMSISSTTYSLQLLESHIARTKLLIDAIRLKEDKEKQNKIKKELEGFETKPAKSAFKPTPKIKPQTPEPPTSSASAYIQKPKVKVAASQPRAIESDERSYIKYKI